MVEPSALPRWQLGYVSPLPVVDAMHYEFYQVVPSGVVFIATPLPIDTFSDASAALIHASRAVDYLHERGANRIVFGGLPVSAAQGRSAMLALMDAQQQRVGISVTSDFEDAIAALRNFSTKTVTIAAKWKPAVLNAVARYVEDAGLRCVGVVGGDYEARDVMKINTLDSVDLGVALGRQALTAHPSADALLLGGGTWLSIPICATLERELGKPVVSNMAATFWNALRQFGLALPPEPMCRLLAGTR